MKKGVNTRRSMIGEDDGKGKSHFQAPDNVNSITKYENI